MSLVITDTYKGKHLDSLLLLVCWFSENTLSDTLHKIKDSEFIVLHIE